MLNEQTSSPHTKKRTRSPMALQVDSLGRVDISGKTTRAEQDRLSAVSELCYGRHVADFMINRAAAWWRALWRDSEPREAHFAKIHRPIIKGMFHVEKI